ncbi:copper resistance D family protein [Candidatus Palauibacter irciniicola]|uniref:copper resistance D family protein n=1 Tax=Candidatus Palauibacter irciniicola TaxID=3056733 RepID=UPI003B01B827
MWFLIGTFSRWALFAGLLVAVGALAFKLVVLRRYPGFGPVEDEAAGVTPERLAARLGGFAVLLAGAGALGRLAAEVSIFRDPFEPLAAEVRLLVTGTSWGRAWLAQVAAVVVSGLAFALASARGPRAEFGWMVATAGVALLAYTPALAGHAVGAEHFVTPAITADIFHMVAGGVWLGTLAVMAGVLYLGRRRGAGVSKRRIIEWISAFSPLALGSAAVIAVTGLFAAWLHVGTVSALWTEPYGRTLSLKLFVVLAVAGCGAYNWRRAPGRVGESGDPPRLPPTVTVELSAAGLLLLVTAVLTGTPPPAH